MCAYINLPECNRRNFGKIDNCTVCSASLDPLIGHTHTTYCTLNIIASTVCCKYVQHIEKAAYKGMPPPAHDTGHAPILTRMKTSGAVHYFSDTRVETAHTSAKASLQLGEDFQADESCPRNSTYMHPILM